MITPTHNSTRKVKMMAATATGTSGNTSEFSAPRMVVAG
jgi:hypothetical protein